MKKYLRLTLFIAAASLGLMAPATATAAGFEGHIKMKIESGKGDPTFFRYSMKDQRLRMEMPSGQETMVGLLDWEKREMSMLMPGQQMYMVIELKDVPMIEDAQKAQDSTTLEKTSETATIAGRQATKYLARDGKTVTELWLTSGLGSWFNMSGGNPMKPKKLSDWEKEVIAKGLFPLRIVTFDKKGKKTMTSEVVELDPQKLDDSLFLPPAGYTKFSMGNLLKGLGGK